MRCPMAENDRNREIALNCVGGNKVEEEEDEKRDAADEAGRCRPRCPRRRTAMIPFELDADEDPSTAAAAVSDDDDDDDDDDASAS